jgi:hypothetical protein
MQTEKAVVFVPYWVVNQIVRAGDGVDCLLNLDQAYQYLSAEDLAVIHCLNNADSEFAKLIPECVLFVTNHWSGNSKYFNHVDPLVPLASGTLADRLFSVDSRGDYAEGQEYRLINTASNLLVVSVQAGWFNATNPLFSRQKERMCLDILEEVSRAEPFSVVAARPSFGVRIGQIYELVSEN